MVKCAKCGGRHDVMPRATDGKMECWDCWQKRETAAEKARLTREARKRAAAGIPPANGSTMAERIEWDREQQKQGWRAP